MYPCANPNLEVFDFDSSVEGETLLCEVPAQGGKALRFSVPPAVVDLVGRCDGRTSLDELVAAYQRDHGGRHSDEQVRRLFTDFLLPNGFVAASPGAAAELPTARRSFLHVQLSFLPSRWVDPVAHRLRWAFTPWAVALWLLLFVACQVYFFAHVAPRSDVDLNRLDSLGFLALMGLTTVSALIHEIGHATAAARYGCRGFRIGWGLYLVFAVFYADVSQAWRLPRRQRVVVDLGGIYFQALFLVLMCLGWWWTAEPFFALGFLVTELALVTALNPFLRLDGYWLVSDFAGIPNLRRASLRFFRELAANLGRRDWRLPAVGLRPRTAIVLAAYSLVGLVFFTWVAAILVDRVAFSLVAGYPDVVRTLGSELAAEPRSWLAVVSVTLELLWRSVLLVGLAILVGRFLRLAGRGLVRGFHWLGRRRPVAHDAVPKQEMKA